MKNILLSAFLAVYAFVLYTSCASQQPVTGGAKDTIPPTLLESYPINKSLNFKDQKITLVFDEFIKEDQIKTKLIITPDDQNKFDVLIKKTSLTLEFENPFADSTTYTLNFNSTISDITENNDAENIILAFSTTTYIDSLSITGSIIDLMTQEPLKEITVALYQAKDTTDIFNKRPLYFAKTAEDGTYSIENLKNGSYRIYAFQDKNKNNLCESNDEPHGFIADTLALTQNIDSLVIPIIRNDVRPLAQLNSRTSGIYFESRYNKPLKDFSVQILDSLKLPNWTIEANLTTDGRGIVFYPVSNPKKDSLQIAITSIDSTYNQTIDTAYLKFTSSKRTIPPFTFTTIPAKDEQILEKTTFTLSFTKPVATHYIADSMRVSIDTLVQHPIRIDTIIWNSHKTRATVNTQIDKKIVPNAKLRYEHLTDSLKSDTSSIDFKRYNKIKNLLDKVEDNYTRVKLPKGTFFSVDGDTSYTENIPLRFINSEERGIIRGNIITDQTHYTLQLVTNKYKVVFSQPGTPSFEFKNVPPGDYTFRVLIDDNKDGVWSTGNSLKRIEPESVYIYPEFFNVRQNWTQENIELTF
ncbi:MAG: Ig-like domain-containing domain [Imperialibacter sp.]|uniref:Ig-like domain-containing domain n=1 Tax=Imperialibacter sp. TaxID=2038411 RepID=UPI0032EEFF10